MPRPILLTKTARVAVLIASAVLMLALFGLTQAFALPSQVLAATSMTFDVNSTADAVDANTGDGICDSDLVTPGEQCTLRAAVQQANSYAGPNTINLPSGNYNLTIGEYGEDDAAKGDLDIKQGLTIKGVTGSIIDAKGLDRVFDIAAGVSVTLSGLVVQGGNPHPGGYLNIPSDGGGIRNAGNLTLNAVTVAHNTTSDGGSSADGGGIYNSGTLTISNSHITGNTAKFFGQASSSGGGIANRGTLIMTDSTITDNSTGGGGGGIIIWPDALTTLTNVTISNNDTIADGGGILNLSHSPMVLNHVVIRGNSGYDGGGITGSNSSGKLTDVKVLRNTADFAGAGIYLYRSSDLRMVRSQVRYNSSSQLAGGIYNDGVVTITQSTIAHNLVSVGTNGNGGGIYNRGRVKLTESTIFSNTAYMGSAIFNDETGTVRMRNVTITRNRARNFAVVMNYNRVTLLNVTLNRETGGGLYTYADGGLAFAKNSIFFFEDKDRNIYPNCAGPIISRGHNLSSDSSCSQYFTASGDLNNTDPRLGGLRKNGGPTRTHAPQPGSPAIDGGDTNGCPRTDQRGVRRPVDGDGNQTAICDIGAVELGASPP